MSVDTPVEHALRRVLPDTVSVDGSGHLHIGGCDTTELTRQFGTPLFVFCEETFRERARAFTYPDYIYL